MYLLYWHKRSNTDAEGATRCDASGARTRGESHCLIIGDPGLGKSQLLKYCAKVSQRAVLTNGIGTTSAGLTVTAQVYSVYLLYW